MSGRKVDVDDLIASGDVGELLGVAKNTISLWKRDSKKGFPEPVVVVSNGFTPVYLRSEIVTWWKKQNEAKVEAATAFLENFKRLEEESL